MNRISLTKFYYQIEAKFIHMYVHSVLVSVKPYMSHWLESYIAQQDTSCKNATDYIYLYYTAD